MSEFEMVGTAELGCWRDYMCPWIESSEKSGPLVSVVNLFEKLFCSCDICGKCSVTNVICGMLVLS